MPTIYRGAGVGTYWHTNDARVSGFIAQSPGLSASVQQMMQHIANATTKSPYISLTRSYGVAEDYAVKGGRALPTSSVPGYVYEVELQSPLSKGLQLLDPVMDIATSLPTPTNNISYQHNGDQNLLLGIVDHMAFGYCLHQIAKRPGWAKTGGIPLRPNISIEIQALVRALRDAELLAIGNIPSSCTTSLRCMLICI